MKTTSSPKQQLIRSEKYRRHIASQPCVMCGGTDVQAAHFRLRQGAGMSQKPGDDMCWPGCVRCHREQGDIGEAKFWRRFLAYANDEMLAEVISGWRRDRYREWKDG